MKNTYKKLMDIIAKQVCEVNALEFVKDGRSDWINPTSNSGHSDWKTIHLEVQDYDQNIVEVEYVIHSDAKISVLKNIIQMLQADEDEMLVMAKGRDGGDSIGLLSDLKRNHFRSAIPGFYLYLRNN